MSTDSSGLSSPATPATVDERAGHLSPLHYEVEENFTLPEEDPILKLTTGVVKTVKELSDKVHKSKPNDYVDLVKVRRLLSETLLIC
jgi:hypothetical protein